MSDQKSDSGTLGLDHLSLEGVMKEHQSALLRYATRVLNNEMAAQDVVQEAFIRLHKNWKKVMNCEIPIKAWLFRTTHNVSVDYIRKESRRALLHKRHSNEYKPYVCPNDNSSDFDERRKLVLHHLHVLKPNERAVLILRLQEEMSYRQIATVVKRSEGYVGTLIHTATKKLTQSLQRAGVLS